MEYRPDMQWEGNPTHNVQEFRKQLDAYALHLVLAPELYPYNEQLLGLIGDDLHARSPVRQLVLVIHRAASMLSVHRGDLMVTSTITLHRALSPRIPGDVRS